MDVSAANKIFYLVYLEKMEKSIQDRVKECVNIVKKLTESLGLPDDCPEVTELRAHMNTYIRSGEPWSGVVDFSAWGRMAHCNFPRGANKPVEVTLKACKKAGSKLVCE
jgi:methionyl-tRNA synthetase